VPEAATDQASGLRRLQRPVKVIAVSSGKGGVGKTTVSVNLAIALALQQQRVMLLDADFGLANIDVLLGLHPQHNLSHVLSGECRLEDVIVSGPHGVDIVPAASGKKRMAELDARENAGLIHAFSELTSSLDVLIIDTAAGLSESVVSFAQAAHHVLVVVCDEPASITDAYALMKVLHRSYGIRAFKALTNMTRGAEHGYQLYDKIARVAERFLDVTLEHAGNIPQDEYLRKAIQRQVSVLDGYPSSRAAAAFRTLAQQSTRWGAPASSCGRLEFFAERLIGAEAVAATP
jgi:flagellar biosynthesis protein FlhG